MPLTEADTCRKLVVPKLQAASWDSDPHSIAEQRTITDGRIVPVGQGFVRKPPRRVDYLLRFERNFPLAVVEAKAAASMSSRNQSLSFSPTSAISCLEPSWRSSGATHLRKFTATASLPRPWSTSA